VTDIPSEAAALAPVHDSDAAPNDGIGIALSGGGFRAMLFHAGTLLRLFEVGLLKDAARISSVSGGSITAGVLALAWNKMDWTSSASFVDLVVDPLRNLASRTIDWPSVVLGMALPGVVAPMVERAYRRHLFGTATLQDLPDSPRFVINATNVKNGRLWRFSKPYIGDWETGRILAPDVPLARAVTASSGFPPFLSPTTFSIDVNKLIDTAPGIHPESEVVLMDGGVYDNLGLETVWKNCRTLLVSDGGAALQYQSNPSRLWSLQAYRALGIIQEQVNALRIRQLIASLRRPATEPLGRDGAYFGIGDSLCDDDPQGSLKYPSKASAMLAGTPTRLEKLDEVRQKQLINWGYAICDARVRRFYRPELSVPSGYPYSEIVR
jgi:NTE family protein